MQISKDVYKDRSWSAPEMILELADEEQKRGENRKEQLFRHSTGLDYQM